MAGKTNVSMHALALEHGSQELHRRMQQEEADAAAVSAGPLPSTEKGDAITGPEQSANQHRSSHVFQRLGTWIWGGIANFYHRRSQQGASSNYAILFQTFEE